MNDKIELFDQQKMPTGQRKTWEKPLLLQLDVNKTKGGPGASRHENKVHYDSTGS